MTCRGRFLITSDWVYVRKCDTYNPLHLRSTVCGSPWVHKDETPHYYEKVGIYFVGTRRRNVWNDRITGMILTTLKDFWIKDKWRRVEKNRRTGREGRRVKWRGWTRVGVYLVSGGKMPKGLRRVIFRQNTS